jgi:DNA-binding CsgD family transcriptional regulator/hemerythrin
MKLKIKPTGHAEIDRQHAILHEMSARFKNICRRSNDQECTHCIPGERRHCAQSLEQVAGSVLSLLAGHTNYEEKLMRLLPNNASCREHVRQHKRSHAEFTLRLRTLAGEIDEEGPQKTSDLMHGLLIQWLGEHAALFDEPLLAEFGGRWPSDTEFDDQLVAILDQYVFHGRPTGLHSPLRDNDTRRQVEARLGRLTPRQRQVCALVAKGLTNKTIADKLGTTVNTIKTHRSEIYRKLEVRSLLDLVLLMDIVKA